MSTTAAIPAFGTVLKEWRGVRRMSQLELGSIADVSPRHISFLETGRSQPSRQMILHLANVLDVPRQERNRLLGAAGFAPQYESHAPDSAAMKPIADAIEWTLRQHDPFPAIVLDRHWNVVNTNSAGSMMFAMLELAEQTNLIHEFVHGHNLRERIVNWSKVGYFLLTRLRTESAAVGGDPVLDEAISALAKDPSITPPSAARLPPVLPAIFRIGDTEVSLLSTIAQFGSAEDIALADQRLELFFPADEATKQLLLSVGIDEVLPKT